MFNNQIIAGAAGQGSGFYSYSIDQSLRLDKTSSANLSFTPSSAGSTNTGTISVWLKRTLVGTYQIVYQANGGTYDSVWINTSDQLQVILGSTSTAIVGWNRKFRDTGSWGHLVIKLDVSNGTANQRIVAYWNGEDMGAADLSGSTSYPASSAVFAGWFKNAVTQRINFEGGSTYGDGYIAEMHVIDGTALDATSFGETSNGVWVPKAYSGSYGTNGFYLSFADSGNIGDDLSGNTNDFTATNLAAHDVVPDSPTNNFATLNENDEIGLNAFAEGSLRYSGASASSFGITRATFSASNHKCYWETYGASTPTDFRVGLMQTGQKLVGSASDYLGLQSTYPGSVAFEPNTGRVRQSDGTHSSVYTAASGGDVINHAFDPETGKYYVGINGTYINSGDPAAGTGNIDTLSTTDTFAPAVSDTATGNKYFNFGQDGSFAGNKTSGGYSDGNGNGDFFNQPPTGFLALCSASIPEPDIGPNSDTTSDEHFNTVLYTGDGTTSNAITGVGFQPDFTWIKSRSQGYRNNLQDSVRGAGKVLNSGYSDAEVDAGTSVGTSWFQSFDSDGFTVGQPNSGTYSGSLGHNESGTTFASWNWKAGGTAVSNTDGSITSSISANQDAGFSIVSYTGTGSNATVGHGLSSAPEMVIVKNRTTASRDWAVGHDGLGSWGNYIQLNLTNALTSAAAIWNSTAPTSSVFSIGTNVQMNTSGNNHIAYCFHSVEGFSKVGKYTGNGNAEGTFVYTGFRPAWVMLKRSSSSGTGWSILDAKRNTFNAVDKILQPNVATAEQTSFPVDFCSNGFKWRTSDGTHNASATFIYLAFAEAPFKYANAR